ncbi:c-type cytochrome [Thiorhodospira sibirica]|uniref:c-type cytochrome n=1 Tax=Thiorhodospira sibirica TaxID=154347 RepID=UPI00022C1183|nr:c-type cytochrome [Thiorhodospira sibirica]
MKKSILSSVALAVALALSSAAHAGDVAAGKEIYDKQRPQPCSSCHGAQGQGMAIFPPLTKHSVKQTTDLLKRYRAGETVGSNTALMTPHAKNLSDEDIANLAAYIATF